MSNESDDDPEEEEPELQPGDADYDLSEAHGYLWKEERGFWPPPAWFIVAVTLIAVIGLVLPAVLIVLRYA
jgi:hypothetical protein